MPSPKYIPMNGKVEIKCPDCQTELSPELIPFLVNGTDVYCENCGFLFTGISQEGEVKPLDEKYKESDNEQMNLSKREDQWVEWKKEWGSIKHLALLNWKKISKEIVDSTSQVVAEIQDSLNNGNQKSSRQENGQNKQVKVRTLDHSPFNGAAVNENSNVPKPTVPTPPPKPKGQSTQEQLEKAIDLLVKLTPLYYAIIFIGTIINFGVTTATGKPEFLTVFGSFAAEIFIMNMDYQTFLPQEREKRVPHAGLSLVIVGLLGLRGNAISLLIFTRGILHLIKFTQTPKDLARKNPALHNNPQQGPIWVRESIIAYLPYIQKLAMIYFISGLFTTIKGFVESKIGYGIFTLLISILGLFLFYGYLLPQMKKYREYTPLNTTIFMIVVGIITSANGMGVPLILMALMLWDSSKYPNTPFLGKKDITELRIRLVASPTTASLTFIADEPGQNIRKFNPETGVLLNNEQMVPNVEDDIDFSPNSTETQELKTIPEVKKQFDEDTPRERIFNILSPQNRAKFINLPLSDQERDEIAKSLVYLDEQHQSRYLDELSVLNPQSHTNIDNYINRIIALPLPKDQHDFLVEQLHYLPEDNFEEFVAFLEQTIKVTP